MWYNKWVKGKSTASIWALLEEYKKVLQTFKQAEKELSVLPPRNYLGRREQTATKKKHINSQKKASFLLWWGYNLQSLLDHAKEAHRRCSPLSIQFQIRKVFKFKNLNWDWKQIGSQNWCNMLRFYLDQRKLTALSINKLLPNKL